MASVAKMSEIACPTHCKTCNHPVLFQHVWGARIKAHNQTRYDFLPYTTSTGLNSAFLQLEEPNRHQALLASRAISPRVEKTLVWLALQGTHAWLTGYQRNALHIGRHGKAMICLIFFGRIAEH